jgi:hypothetical protein
MNKKEQAALAQLEKELGIAKAFQFKEYVLTPINVETASKRLGNCDGVVVAWYANTYNGSVSEGCFNRVNHCSSRSDKTTTQGQGGPWYETKREALMAVRLVKQRAYAEDLARIDREIAAAE